MRTQFHGLCRDYMEAAFNWHRRSRTPGDLYTEQKPRQHLFRIPQVIGVGDLPGPDFSTSAYRLSHDLPNGPPALLHFHDHPQAGPLLGIDGALQDAKDPRVMVFDHAVGKTIFGAERSLLNVMSRMVTRR